MCLGLKHVTKVTKVANVANVYTKLFISKPTIMESIPGPPPPPIKRGDYGDQDRIH